MTITAITDHTQRALDLTLGQFWESPRMRALIVALVESVQDAEDLGQELAFERLLENAIGQQLDDYGMLVGQNRMGLNDILYRRLIETKIAANRSSGQIPLLLQVMSIVLGAVVEYQQKGVASYELSFTTSSPASSEFVVEIEKWLLLLTPVGVEFALIEGGEPNVFRFDDFYGFDLGTLSRRLI